MKTAAALSAILIAVTTGCGGSSGGGVQPDAAEVEPDAAKAVDAPPCQTHTFYKDQDGDGFGDAAQVTQSCTQPAGYVAQAGDCDDQNPQVHAESAFYRDADHDGYGAGAAMTACYAPSGYVAQANDCDDADATSHPGGTEICDGHDNDCDGGIDGTAAQPNQCGGLVGSFTGVAYSHQATEHVGTTIVNQMTCNGTGPASFQLGRTPALQGTFSCNYSGGLTLFDHAQTATLSASVGLDGKITGTIDHVYNSFDGLHKSYSITGTLTGHALTINGTGTFLPNPMATVPWDVTLSNSGSR